MGDGHRLDSGVDELPENVIQFVEMQSELFKIRKSVQKFWLSKYVPRALCAV